MAMLKTVVRFLSSGLPASRRLSLAFSSLDSITETESEACEGGVPLQMNSVTESEALSKDKSLYKRISVLSSIPGGTVEKTMEEWKSEGKSVPLSQLTKIVWELRRYHNHRTALELLDWMDASGIELNSSSHAIRLNLIAKHKGIDMAESYFAKLPENNKTEQTYGALLGCYCQRKMSDKAVALHHKMQELNIISHTLTYNNLMFLHLRSGHPEKIFPLFQEMKAANVSPNSFTYGHIMNSYSSINDIDSVERFVEEIEKDAEGRLSWNIYSHMASLFVKAGLFNKAEAALVKFELVMDRHDRECYDSLINRYADIGNLAGVVRVWKLLKDSFDKTVNKSFLIMFRACIKLDDMDVLKQCYDEWKCSFTNFDIRLPSLVLATFLEKDMIKEAENVLENYIERGYENDSLWIPFLEWRLKKKEVDLALKSLKFVTSCNKPHQWIPKKEVVMKFFIYFEAKKDVEKAEEFFKILKDLNIVDMDMYKSLLRTYSAAGRKDSSLHQRIEEDGFKLSSETENLLESVCPAN